MKTLISGICLASVVLTLCFADWIDAGYISVFTGAVAMSICLLIFILSGYQLDILVHNGQVIEENEGYDDD